jgi:hypothetical protein
LDWVVRPAADQQNPGILSNTGIGVYVADTLAATWFRHDHRVAGALHRIRQYNDERRRRYSSRPIATNSRPGSTAGVSCHLEVRAMKAIVDRLIADLKWRLSAPGRKFQPKAKERASWGAPRVPGSVPWLVWGAYMLFAVVGVGSGSMALAPPQWDWLIYLLFDWPGWVLSFILVFNGAKALNQLLEVQAYARLLRRNERFTLVEYAKYLLRQVQRAREDPALGGPAEVARLEQLHRKLSLLLRGGAGVDPLPVASALAEEADLAQAVVQSYEVQQNAFAELDQRLPGQLRQRVEELDREVEQARGRIAEGER